jgi:hypothetical protein
MRGENREIRTAEKASWMLGQIRPPVDPLVENAVRARIGKEDVDSGSYAAFVAIAAAAILGALRRGDMGSLPADLQTASILGLMPNDAELMKAEEVLRLVLENKELCKECGAAWKRQVLSLADELKASLDG